MTSENKCEIDLEYFKDAIKTIIKNHYGDAIRIDFNNFMICIDDRCVKYDTYQKMLLGLVVIDFFMRKLPDISSNPSEKSLNIPKIQ